MKSIRPQELFVNVINRFTEYIKLSITIVANLHTYLKITFFI